MQYAFITAAILAVPFGMLFYLYKLAKLESERYVKDLELTLNQINRLKRLKPRVRITKTEYNQFVAQIYLVDRMIWESKPYSTRHQAMQRADGKIDYEKWR